MTATLLPFVWLRSHQLTLSAVQGDVKLAQAPTFPDCYPMSEKVYVEVPFENDVLRVPMRRIYIKDGEDYLDVPDTSGPQVPLLAATPFPAFYI